MNHGSNRGRGGYTFELQDYGVDGMWVILTPNDDKDNGNEEVGVGDRVWARWKGGSFYAGKIKAVNADKSFAVEYDDGDFDSTVPAAHVKLAAGALGTTPQRCWDRVLVAAAAEKAAADKAAEKVLCLLALLVQKYK